MFPRHVLLLAAATLGVLLGGCSEDIEFKNTLPAVTVLGPVPAPEGGVLRVHLWIADYERDAVDVAVEVQVNGGAWVELSPQAVQGHGLVGLTSERDLPGREHVLLWNASKTAGIELDPQSTLRLRVTPDDRRAGVGDPAETPAFVVSEGYQP